MEQKIKVIIVDDMFKYAESLKNALETISDKIVVEAILPNCTDVLKKIKDIKPHLVLMDINFPNEKSNGIDCVKHIRKDYSEAHLKIVMLTNTDNMQNIKSAFAAGASGYIQKSNKDYSWIDYLIEVVEDKIVKVADPKIMNSILLSLKENNAFKLKPREVLLLQYSADGLSAKEIADTTKFTVNTVTTFLKETRETLDAKNITHAVAIAFRNNLIQ